MPLKPAFEHGCAQGGALALGPCKQPLPAYPNRRSKSLRYGEIGDNIDLIKEFSPVSWLWCDSDAALSPGHSKQWDASSHQHVPSLWHLAVTSHLCAPLFSVRLHDGD